MANYTMVLKSLQNFTDNSIRMTALYSTRHSQVHQYVDFDKVLVYLSVTVYWR